MATADEILEGMEEMEEPGVIVIDNDMRTITVPEDIRLLGVENDKEVRRLRFRMPATYGEFDLSEFALRINYMNAAGRGDVYIVKDAQTADGAIEFSWLVGGFATLYKGNVQFIVCAKKLNGSVVEKEFNTTRASLPVLEGLEVPQAIQEQNPDIIEYILSRLGELEENGGGGGGAAIDDTTPSATTTYSSVKINELLNKQKEAIDALGKTGLTSAQINALNGMFKVAAYIKSDVSAEYSAFKTAFGIEDSGGEEPDDPIVPEKTLTGISATYSGGDVAVGTLLDDLTGIVVTATYSDGSTATVTGYTLSGEIVEGSNTITVSYGGMTTTFTVTGVAESGGDDNIITTDITFPLTLDAGQEHQTTVSKAFVKNRSYKCVIDGHADAEAYFQIAGGGSPHWPYYDYPIGQNGIEEVVFTADGYVAGTMLRVRVKGTGSGRFNNITIYDITA